MTKEKKLLLDIAGLEGRQLDGAYTHISLDVNNKTIPGISKGTFSASKIVIEATRSGLSFSKIHPHEEEFNDEFTWSDDKDSPVKTRHELAIGLFEITPEEILLDPERLYFSKGRFSSTERKSEFSHRLQLPYSSGKLTVFLTQESRPTDIIN